MTANPQTVLALLDEIEKLKQDYALNVSDYGKELVLERDRLRQKLRVADEGLMKCGALFAAKNLPIGTDIVDSIFYQISAIEMTEKQRGNYEK